MYKEQQKIVVTGDDISLKLFEIFQSKICKIILKAVLWCVKILSSYLFLSLRKKKSVKKRHGRAGSARVGPSQVG